MHTVIRQVTLSSHQAVRDFITLMSRSQGCLTSVCVCFSFIGDQLAIHLINWQQQPLSGHHCNCRHPVRWLELR